MFANPIATHQSMIQYYESYGEVHVRSLELPQKLVRNVTAIDEEFKEVKNRRFLDVGAASGELVKGFQEKGWEAHGIELSEAFVHFAQNQRGLENILNCEIEKAPYEENYFDYVHFWHVIEHLRDPGLVLRKIHSWLKPGGVLNLGTPNADLLVLKVLTRLTGVFDLGKDHTYGFPPKTLANYLKSLGFTIENHETYNSQSKRMRKRRKWIQEKLPFFQTMQRIRAVKN